YAVLSVVSDGYPPSRGRLSTRSSPVRHVSCPKATPFDLHALGTPPALILSQDQTLHHVSLRFDEEHHQHAHPHDHPCHHRRPRTLHVPQCPRHVTDQHTPKRLRLRKTHGLHQPGVGFASSSAHHQIRYPPACHQRHIHK